MKVLCFNTGYFLNYEGTYLDYLKKPWKSLIGSKKEKDNLEKFLKIVESEEPDFVLLQEVDGGSIRTSTSGQQKYLTENISDKYDSNLHNKYRGRIHSNMPLLRYMGNAVFYNTGEVENHSLSIGRKNLVQEIRLESFSIFSLHLSTFGGWIRKKQLEQVKKIAENREEYLIAGDLNLHKGRREIKYLEKELGEKVHSPGKTFPAKDPVKKLDLVASSENVEIRNLEELGNCFSDHRPFKFEIKHLR